MICEFKTKFKIAIFGEKKAAIPIDSSDNAFLLNDTSLFIFSRLLKGKEIQTIINELVDEYNVKKDIAKQDVETFISHLKQQGYVEIK